MRTRNPLIPAIFALVPDAQISLVGDTLDGLEWLDERERPTDDAILAKVTELAAKALAPFVDKERDRRINGPIVFEGVTYQGDAEARENIMGASIVADKAIQAGAQPGDLRWKNPDKDFEWIAADNSKTPMDAQTVFAFGLVMLARKETMIMKARDIKDMLPIPTDYTADSYWT